MNAPARTPTAETSVTVFMAEKVGMLPEAFEATVRRLCMPPHHRTGQEASREEFAAFLLVCKHHELNPLTREIFAMPQKTGGFVPVVSVDGWLKLVNRHPQMDGMEFEETLGDKGALVSATCRIYRKDRKIPISVTEYFGEVKRNTDPWRDMPHRMLRHKAMIQCARYAFGFAGIYDEDEAERIVASVDAQNGPPPAPPVSLPDMRRAAAPAIEHKPKEAPTPSPAPEQPASPVSRAQAVGAEVPASAPDNTAPGEPAGNEPVDAEVYDGERQLAEIGNQLASVRTLDEVGEVEQAYADAVEEMSRTDREKAAHLFEQARERLTPAEPAKTQAAPEGESLIEDWAAYESRMRRLADGTNTPEQADGLRKVWNGSKKYRTLMLNKGLVTRPVRVELGKYVEAALHRAEDVAGGQEIAQAPKPAEPQPEEPATVSAAPAVTAEEPEAVRVAGGKIFEEMSKVTSKEQAYLVWARSADLRASCGASPEVLDAWAKEYREIRKRLPSEED